MSKNINIAIVDASVTWRHLLSSLLEKNNFLVTHKCNDEYELLDNISNSRIDILIIDININNKNGLDVVKLLKVKLPKTPIFVYSLICDPIINQKLLNVGVIKCFHKNNFKDLERELFKFFKLEFVNKKTDFELSNQDLELLNLICLDYDKYEISEKLCISLSTYEKKRKSLAVKLNVKNTNVALVIWAFKNNIFE